MSKSNSKGTQLKINNKVVGGLTSINGIEVNADTVDLTALDNTSGYREKAADFKDVGDVTASGFLDGADDGQDECLSLLDSGEAVACQIIFPQKIGKTWSFTASVVRFSTGAELSQGVSFELSLAVTGKPTLAATAPAGNGD